MRSSHPPEIEEITLVIPVKDNQTGVNRLLKTFFETHKADSYPAEIIIVDNNSEEPLTIASEYQSYDLDIQVLQCKKTGPAAARNLGAKQAKGKWLLFVDSDCIPTESMVTGYLSQSTKAVAYQGLVGAIGKDYLSRYYVSQQIHLPPSKPNESPKYLVTANALVLKKVFDSICGFNEQFTMAGGEDIELALRLAEEGQLSYARESKITHDFNDGLSGFVKRFIRYGRGNRLVREFHNISLIPLPSTAKNKSAFVNNLLVILQWLCLLLGYVLESIELLGKKTPLRKVHSSENGITSANYDNHK